MKEEKGRENFILLVIKTIIVGLSASNFYLFISSLENDEFSFLQCRLYILIFLFAWIGFSFIVSRLNNSSFFSILSKDAIFFFPFLLLYPLLFFLERLPFPNIVLYKLFFFILITSIVLSIKASFVRPFQIKENYGHLILGIFVLLYFSIYSFLLILNYYHLSIMKCGDLTIFNQIFWYTIHGKQLYSQMLGYNFLGEHFSPIIIIFAPFYWIFPHPLTLLILQTLIIGIGAIPLYMIAKYKLKNPFLALSFSLAYLLYPMTSRINLIDFRKLTLFLPLFLFCFFFLEKERWKLYFLFLFLSLMIKENISIIVIFLGFYILLIKRRRGIGFITIAIGLAWAYLSVGVVMPYIREVTSKEAFSGYPHLGRYSSLGKSFSEIILNLLFHPKAIILSLPFEQRFIMFNNLIYLLVPLGFLSLTSIIIVLAIPEFLLQSLSSTTLQYFLLSGHSASFIPIVLLAGIYGVANITRVFPQVGKHPLAFFGYILSLSLLSNYYLGFPPLKLTLDVRNYEFKKHKTIFSIPLNLKDYQIPENAKTFFMIRKIVPDKAKVSFSSDLGPYLSKRKTILGLDKYKEADYVILNIKPNTWVYIDQVFQALNLLLKDKDFKLIFAKNGIYLFGKIKEVKR
ncbi:MAG: DUF2079 domain-containing protein [bacterium]